MQMQPVNACCSLGSIETTTQRRSECFSYLTRPYVPHSLSSGHRQGHQATPHHKFLFAAEVAGSVLPTDLAHSCSSFWHRWCCCWGFRQEANNVVARQMNTCGCFPTLSDRNLHFHMIIFVWGAGGGRRERAGAETDVESLELPLLKCAHPFSLKPLSFALVRA